MRENICPHEATVATAVRTGLWDGTVRDHAAACAACQELIIAANHVRSLAEGFVGQATAPDAAWLWRKALLEQKQAEADRAQRPFRVAQVVSIPAAVMVVSLLIAWGVTQLQAYGLGGPWQQLSQTWWLLPASTAHVSSEGLSTVLLIAIAVIVVAHPLLAEE